MISSKKIKPEFFIVGPPKCGTTSLYHILNKHPEIQMSSIKEPHYFSDINYKDAIKNDNEYFSLFKNVSENQLGGEASTSYFPFYKQAISNIIDKIGVNTSIIIILRDPCKRAFSHYQYYKKLGRELNSFSQVISEKYIVKEEPWEGVINPYVEFGFYFNAVNAYIQAFKKIHFIFLDELEENYVQTLRSLFMFLNVDSSYIPENEKRNVSGELKIKSLKFFLNSPFFYKFITGNTPYRLKVQLRRLLLKREEIEYKDLIKLQNLYQNDYQKTKKLIEAFQASSGFKKEIASDV